MIQVGAFYHLSIILNLVFFVNLKPVSIEIIFNKPIWFAAIAPPEFKSVCPSNRIPFYVGGKTIMFFNEPRLIAEAFSLVRCPDNAAVFVLNPWESWVWHNEFIGPFTTVTRVGWPDQIISVLISNGETSILLKPQIQVVPFSVCVRRPYCFFASLIVSVEHKVSITLKCKLKFINFFMLVISFCESKRLFEMLFRNAIAL